MLLSSSYNPSQPPRLSPQYTQQQQSNMLAFSACLPSRDGMWNDLDLQLSSMPAPSLSRRASTQRPTTTSTLQRGNSMRIVKPSQSASTHNSPLGFGLTNKAALGRRMTVMGDTSGYRRRRLLEATAGSAGFVGQQQQQITHQQSQGQNQMRQRAGMTRPMSWCPTTSTPANPRVDDWGGNTTQQQGEAILRRQAAQYSPESQLRLQQLQQWQQMQAVQDQQVQQQEAARMQLQMQEEHQAAQAAQEVNYFAMPPQAPSQGQTGYFSQQNTPLTFPSYSLPMNNYYDTSYAGTPLDMPMASQNTFPTEQDYGIYNNLSVPQAFMNASTTPPTPETFPLQDQFQPQYINSESSLFSLDHDTTEDEGEVLVGLGLYSAPEKTAPKPVVEPHIVEMYARAGVPISPEMAGMGKGGKGLKLEETWEPPKEEESEEEEDAEGDEDDEDPLAGEEAQAISVMPLQGQGLMGPPVGWL